MRERVRTAVLISGRGSNMVALADACEIADFPAQIVGVLADKVEAGGLDVARARGIPATAVVRKDFASKQDHEDAIQAQLGEWNTELVALAGFMRLLTPEFLAPWDGRIINIHPSLLPKFKGLDTHQRAIDAGEREHGCTVHHVTAGMDEGPVIAQARVPVLASDTADTLSARVLVEEHRLYPQALAQIARELRT